MLPDQQENGYGGGRPRTARTMENVETFVLNQEDRPGTHRTIRQVSRETGISRTSGPLEGPNRCE